MRRAGGGPPLPGELEALIRRVLEASRLGPALRREVEADLRAHFEDGLDAGLSPEELTARFGDPAAAGRRIGRARGGIGGGEGGRGGWWVSRGESWAEARQAARRLARAPGFAAVVVATLALGVGANTAIFTVLHAVLLKPLPYSEPDRLVRVYEAPADQPAGLNYLRAPAVVAFRTWDDVFESFGALYTYRETGADLTEGGSAARVTVVRVSAGYFETLGVRPALGRTFLEEESLAPGAPSAREEPIARVAVLGHALWRERFGGEPGVLGRTIRLDGEPYVVVGVMPRGFSDPFGAAGDLWTPQDLRFGGYNSWGNFYLSGVARLAPGLTLAAARERLQARFDQLVEANPDAGGRWRPLLVPLHDDLVGSTRRTMLLILAGAAGLVLLTACVNLANLLVARGLGRDRDVAVRAALGSGRGRIALGLILETAFLALLGGVAGLALGWAGVRGLLALSPDALPGVARPRLDGGVLAFTLLATLLALLVAGLSPALRLSRTAPAQALRSEGRSATGGRHARRLRDALAVAQVAAALVLVAGAALLGRSLAALRDVPLGLDPDGVLAFEVHLPEARYPDGASRDAFHSELRERLARLPAVERAGAVSWLPLSGRYHVWGVYWDPESPFGGNDDAWRNTDVRVIAGDYFGALGIPLLRGSAPPEADPEGERTIWVGRRFAEEVFGDADPIGQFVWAGNEIRRVVGVVGDVPWAARGDLSRTLYIPHAQFADDRNWPLFQVVRARGSQAALLEEVRRVLAGMDGQLVLHRPRAFVEVVAAARGQERFATALMGAFALLALVLSLLGTYGVLAGSVARRTREFGIRMALGADGGAVRRMVLRYTAALVAPGVLLGLAGAWLGARWLRALLFQVEPGDPLAYAAAATVLAIAGLAAGWVPARRATRVDPARTLSAE